MRRFVSVKPFYHLLIIFGVVHAVAHRDRRPVPPLDPRPVAHHLLATAMHAGIGIMMGLNLFELLMIVMLLAFLPDRVIRDWLRGGTGAGEALLRLQRVRRRSRRGAGDGDRYRRAGSAKPDALLAVPAVTNADGEATGRDGERCSGPCACFRS